MKQKQELICWIKKHKRQLIVAGVSVSALLGVVLGLRHQKELAECWSMIKSIMKLTDAPIKPYDNVCGDGNKEKIVEATANIVIADIVGGIEVGSQATKEYMPRAPHDVNLHLRKLPVGLHASAEKIASASEIGIDLPNNYTWVKSYRTGIAA